MQISIGSGGNNFGNSGLFKLLPEKVRRILLIILACIIGVGAIGFLIYSLISGGSGALIPSIIFVAIAAICIISIILGIKKSKFKSSQMSNIIKEIFPDCEYEPENCISRQEYKDLEMLSIGEYFVGSDMLKGKTSNGTPFNYCEIYTYDENEDNEGHTHTYTRFKGGILTFNYPRNFEYKSVMVSKGFNKGNGFNKGWFNDYKKVETESVEFNNSFKLYSTNAEDAFYIFTPQVMEKFVELNKQYKHGLIFGFKEGKINIAVPSLDMFEPPAFGLKNPKKLEEFKTKTRKQLESFLEIERLLNLSVPNNNQVPSPIQQQPIEKQEPPCIPFNIKNN